MRVNTIDLTNHMETMRRNRGYGFLNEIRNILLEMVMSDEKNPNKKQDNELKVVDINHM